MRGAEIAYAHDIATLLRSTTGKIHLATGEGRPRCGVRSSGLESFDGVATEVTCQLCRRRAETGDTDAPAANEPAAVPAGHAPGTDGGTAGASPATTGRSRPGDERLIAIVLAVVAVLALVWFLNHRRD